MSKNVTITLERPIIGHGPDITRVVYRPPRMREIMQAGHPYTIHRTPDRVPFLCPTSAPVRQIEGLHERRMAGSS